MESVNVDELPVRTVHALHGLLCAGDEQHRGGSAMPTAAEAMLYDYDALSPRHTAAGLRHGARLGLCVCVSGYWAALPPLYDLRRALEDRTLRDEDEARG